MFTQISAQASALARRGRRRIAVAHGAAVLCLPADMKLYRVAAHVAVLRARGVVVCTLREPVGIVRATDGVRVVARS